MSSPRVVLDSCVLVPVSLADTLLRLAERSVFIPLWSSLILEELLSALTRVHPTIHPAAFSRRIAAMNAAFPVALVTDIAPLDSQEAGKFPDVDDVHVAALAKQSQALSVLTFNLRHFPTEPLNSWGTSVAHPDDFLVSIARDHPDVCAGVLRLQAMDTRQPHLGVAEVIARLSQSAPEFSQWASEHLTDEGGIEPNGFESWRPQ